MKKLIICASVCLVAYYQYLPHYTSKYTTITAEVAEPVSAEIQHTVKKVDVLNIIVNDISQSDHWLELPPLDVLALLLSDSSRIKSNQLAGILIDEQGMTQQLYLSEKIALELKSETGSIYDQVAAADGNKKMKERYRQRCQTIVDQFASRVVLPRTAVWSDVNQALEMAARLARLPCYKDHEIRLIVLSDLIQDMPGHHRLKPALFPPNVTIYLVGLDDAVDASLVFPQNQTFVLPHFRASLIQP